MSKKDSEEKSKKQIPLFSEVLKYFKKYGDNDISASEKYFFSNSKEEKTNFFKPNRLREEMLDELDNLTNLFGSQLHYKLENLTHNERKNLRKFLDFYSTCPICKGRNHSNNLKKYYIDEERKNLIQDLVGFMNLSLKNRKLRKLNLNFGIPCCTCFEKLFK